MVEVGRAFYDLSSGHAALGEFDADGVARTIRLLIDSSNALVLVGNGVGIGGVMMPLYYSPGKLVMQEVFWFAPKFARGLLKEFHRESKEMGASFVMLSSLEILHPSIGRFMTRMGYHPLERRYVMEL